MNTYRKDESILKKFQAYIKFSCIIIADWCGWLSFIDHNIIQKYITERKRENDYVLHPNKSLVSDTMKDREGIVDTLLKGLLEDKGQRRGALVGAGVGCIGGLIYGSHVANLKRNYATQKDYLNACVEGARLIDMRVKECIESFATYKIKKFDSEKLQNFIADSEKILRRAQDEIIIQRTVLEREKYGLENSKIFIELDIVIKGLEQNVAELGLQIQTSIKG